MGVRVKQENAFIAKRRAVWERMTGLNPDSDAGKPRQTKSKTKTKSQPKSQKPKQKSFSERFKDFYPFIMKNYDTNTRELDNLSRDVMQRLMDEMESKYGPIGR